MVIGISWSERSRVPGRCGKFRNFMVFLEFPMANIQVQDLVFPYFLYITKTYFDQMTIYCGHWSGPGTLEDGIKPGITGFFLR